MSPRPQPASLLDQLAPVLGPRGLITETEAMRPYVTEWRRKRTMPALAVARPASTAEVAALVGLARAHGVPLVPQGGNTGLVGSSVPAEDHPALVVSLQRMDRVRALDAENFTITVEAGCILAEVQRAAEGVDRLFPLSLGSEGSCRIGGNISSNAGGILTLRYGNTRDLVLGLEVVLPDGRVWDGLRRLRKNNTGYDLKHLFIGAEGTLGIITAAVLKLFPRPRARAAAWVVVPDPAAAIRLLSRLRAATDDSVSAFELINGMSHRFALAHVPGTAAPLGDPAPWACLVEVTSGQDGPELRERLEAALAAAAEAGEATDAVLAETEAQRARLWHIREAIVDGQGFEGPSLKSDASVPVARVPEFLERAAAVVEAACPGARIVAYGHAGDGNIHYNISPPEGSDHGAFAARRHELTGLVNEVVLALDGSISAEHGIGRLKRAEMTHIKSPVELDLMRAVKHALDPDGLMNPGSTLPP